jgi:hypothetical protein
MTRSPEARVLMAILLALILFCNERSDIGLDASSADSNYKDRCDEATEASSVFQRDRQGGKEQDEDTTNVDDSKQDDGLVFAKILIGNDGSENWRHCSND